MAGRLLPVHCLIERFILVTVAAPVLSGLRVGGPASAQPGSVRPCGKPSAAAAGRSWRQRTNERRGGRQGLRRLLSPGAGPAPGVGYCSLRRQSPFSSQPFWVRRRGRWEDPVTPCYPGGLGGQPRHPFPVPPMKIRFHRKKRS